jgi:hypothetical protein
MTRYIATYHTGDGEMLIGASSMEKLRIFCRSVGFKLNEEMVERVSLAKASPVTTAIPALDGNRLLAGGGNRDSAKPLAVGARSV